MFKVTSTLISYSAKLKKVKTLVEVQLITCKRLSASILGNRTSGLGRLNSRKQHVSVAPAKVFEGVKTPKAAEVVGQARKVAKVRVQPFFSGS